MKFKYIIACFLLIGIFIPACSFAQDINETPGSETKPEPQYKFGTQGGVEISYPIRDGAFKMNFVGIYSFNAAVTATVTRGFYVGPDFHYNQFATSVNPKYDTIKTQMIIYEGGLKLGYHGSMLGDFMFSATLSGGEAFVTFNSLPLKAPKTGYNEQSMYFNANLEEYYNAFEGVFVGLQVSFTYLPYNFNPDKIGFEYYYPYVNSDKQGATKFISWGFNLYYCFGKKK